MFLTKRAEEEFINFVKKAQEAMFGESDDKASYANIANLISSGKEEEAIKAIMGLENKSDFFSNVEFLGLPKNVRINFQDAYNKQLAAAQNLTGMTPDEMAKKQKKAEEKAEEKAAKEAVKEAVPAEPVTDEPKDQSTKDTADLDLVPGNTDIKEEASIFDYLHTKADNEAEASISAEGPGTIESIIVAEAKNAKGQGLPQEEALKQAKAVAGVGEGDHTFDEAFNAAYNEANSALPSDIADKTAKVAAFIDAINNYKPEPDANEKILQLAKSSATSWEFLQKVAKELDENPNKQYPGQKVFDEEKTTHGGGHTPKFPGQKAFMVGNPAVESILDISGEPEVDVYKDKAGREKVTKIQDKNGDTIAFMQPVNVEGADITVGFDYNGVVGGEVQRGETPGPKAVAGHTTENYLDKINELADKDPAKLTGKFASQHNNLTKDAGFEFKAGLKKKSNNEVSNISSETGSAMENDSVVDPVVSSGVVDPKKKSLTAEEVSKARERFTHNADLGFVFHKTAAFEENYATAVQLLDRLQKEYPEAYKAVLRAAQTGDVTTFSSVVKNTLKVNLTQSDPEIGHILDQLPYEKVLSEYFKAVVPQEPKAPEPEEKEKGDKKDKGEEGLGGKLDLGEGAEEGSDTEDPLEGLL